MYVNLFRERKEIPTRGLISQDHSAQSDLDLNEGTGVDRQSRSRS